MKCQNCGFQKPSSNRTRSTPQNKFFHGVVCSILSFHTGYTAEEMKAVVKYKFGIKNTSNLTTTEFEMFMKDVRNWAEEQLGCYIPTPNEMEALNG